VSLNEEDKRWITEQIERAETRLLAEFAKRDADYEARRSKAAAILEEDTRNPSA
jgi:hypothetical protein